jgi:hypothetical protein
VTNLNDDTKHLTFYIMGQSHVVHLVNPLFVFHFPITHDVTIIVKTHCITKSNLLVTKLKCKFSNHELMNVLRIIYSQYWLQPNHKSTFVVQLSLII